MKIAIEEHPAAYHSLGKIHCEKIRQEPGAMKIKHTTFSYHK